MTASTAINAILRDRYRRSMALPRYTPMGWWECDVFEITERGYFREYEIKLTLADFRRDSQKMNVHHWEGMKRLDPPREERKHDLLTARDVRGPVQFWFVTPEGLLTNEKLPSWAGLIELRPGARPDLFHPVQRVEAPRLHNSKADPKIKAHALSVCYWRLLHLMIRKPEPVFTP